ncbi:MAG: sigma 54-interacting transcriptional regulator [Eubacteriales bacterium]|nr:sigma 54-interacting transcriptional regulator [Eubacteriales bacterium]
MKKIAIISNIPITADNHKAALNSVFSDVSIEVVPICDLHGEQIKADVALVTAMDIVPYAKKHLSPGTSIVLGMYTLLKEQLEKIKQLALIGDITVVHENRRAALTRLNLLQRLGIAQERLHIWYPGLGEEILTGQIVSFSSEAVPKGVMPEVQIPGRVLSITTLFEVALGLGVQDILSNEGFTSYCNRVCTHFIPSLDDLTIGELNAMVGNDPPQKGLVAFTQSMIIFYCDEYASSLVGSTGDNLIGRELFDAFPFLRSCKIHTGDYDQEQIVVYGGKTYVVKLNLILQTKKETGYVYISDYWVEEQRQVQLRRKVSGNKSKAKYSFHNIVGSSPALIECKNIAYRMACSNSNILITGATGVGKELFAQSIHNASERKNQPFIAVNCGAIVESLLESELFGYEKGAFTGANKNGKQGLFELAHKGTLFLDEIGEMPLHLQVRLLRVLQEKEVVRVGGNQVIVVDVRVIAATNKDIPSMIENREFRSDLFYRLNVLPLYIPPLSSRKEDIMPLCEYFQRELGVSFRFSPEAEKKMLEYPFTGNVRELHNCVEYLANLAIPEVKVTDLPSYVRGAESVSLNVQNRNMENSMPLVPGAMSLTTESMQVLHAVFKINMTGVGAGRRSIHMCLNNLGVFISETSIRKYVMELEDSLLVTVSRGRGGVRVTEQGIEIIKKNFKNS